MPTSKAFGKNWSEAIFAHLYRNGNARRMLDIGVGRGTYSMRWREKFPGAVWTGVEAWEPYVGEFDLRAKYDTLLVEDARSADLEAHGPFDVAIFGDVVEHMEKADAMGLIRRVSQCSRFILVCMPIIYLPQDAFEGNPFEIHRKPDWSHAEAMLSLPDVHAWYVEGQNGLYWSAAAREDAELLVEAAGRANTEEIGDAALAGSGNISAAMRLGLRLRLALVRAGRPCRRWLRRVLPEGVKRFARNLRRGG